MSSILSSLLFCYCYSLSLSLYDSLSVYTFCLCFARCIASIPYDSARRRAGLILLTTKDDTLFHLKVQRRTPQGVYNPIVFFYRLHHNEVDSLGLGNNEPSHKEHTVNIIVYCDDALVLFFVSDALQHL